MRLKKGTKSGDKAISKWHGSMLKRLGSEEAITEWYRTIGRMGGQKGHDGGFGSKEVGADGLTGQQRAVLAGRKGGKISRRGPAKKRELDYIEY